MAAVVLRELKALVSQLREIVTELTNNNCTSFDEIVEELQGLVSSVLSVECSALALPSLGLEASTLRRYSHAFHSECRKLTALPVIASGCMRLSLKLETLACGIFGAFADVGENCDDIFLACQFWARVAYKWESAPGELREAVDAYAETLRLVSKAGGVEGVPTRLVGAPSQQMLSFIFEWTLGLARVEWALLLEADTSEHQAAADAKVFAALGVSAVSVLPFLDFMCFETRAADTCAARLSNVCYSHGVHYVGARQWGLAFKWLSLAHELLSKVGDQHGDLKAGISTVLAYVTLETNVDLLADKTTPTVTAEGCLSSIRKLLEAGGAKLPVTHYITARCAIAQGDEGAAVTAIRELIAMLPAPPLTARSNASPAPVPVHSAAAEEYALEPLVLSDASALVIHACAEYATLSKASHQAIECYVLAGQRISDPGAALQLRLSVLAKVMECHPLHCHSQPVIERAMTRVIDSHFDGSIPWQRSTDFELIFNVALQCRQTAQTNGDLPRAVVWALLELRILGADTSGAKGARQAACHAALAAAYSAMGRGNEALTHALASSDLSHSMEAACLTVATWVRFASTLSGVSAGLQAALGCLFAHPGCTPADCYAVVETVMKATAEQAAAVGGSGSAMEVVHSSSVEAGAGVLLSAATLALEQGLFKECQRSPLSVTQHAGASPPIPFSLLRCFIVLATKAFSSSASEGSVLHAPIDVQVRMCTLCCAVLAFATASDLLPMTDRTQVDDALWCALAVVDLACALEFHGAFESAAACWEACAAIFRLLRTRVPAGDLTSTVGLRTATSGGGSGGSGFDTANMLHFAETVVTTFGVSARTYQTLEALRRGGVGTGPAHTALTRQLDGLLASTNACIHSLQGLLYRGAELLESVGACEQLASIVTCACDRLTCPPSTLLVRLLQDCAAAKIILVASSRTLSGASRQAIDDALHHFFQLIPAVALDLNVIQWLTALLSKPPLSDLESTRVLMTRSLDVELVKCTVQPEGVRNGPAARLARFGLDLFESTTERLQHLDKVRQLVQHCLLGMSASGGRGGGGGGDPRAGTPGIYPYDEADYVVVAAWNQGLQLARLQLLPQAERFMKWALSMIGSVEALAKCTLVAGQSGGTPELTVASISGASASGSGGMLVECVCVREASRMAKQYEELQRQLRESSSEDVRREGTVAQTLLRLSKGSRPAPASVSFPSLVGVNFNTVSGTAQFAKGPSSVSRVVGWADGPVGPASTSAATSCAVAANVAAVETVGAGSLTVLPVLASEPEACVDAGVIVEDSLLVAALADPLHDLDMVQDETTHARHTLPSDASSSASASAPLEANLDCDGAQVAVCLPTSESHPELERPVEVAADDCEPDSPTVPVPGYESDNNENFDCDEYDHDVSEHEEAGDRGIGVQSAPLHGMYAAVSEGSGSVKAGGEEIAAGRDSSASGASEGSDGMEDAMVMVEQ